MTHTTHVYRTNPVERQRLQDDLHLLPPAVAGRVQLLLADFVTALTERRELTETVCHQGTEIDRLNARVAHLELQVARLTPDTTNATYADPYAVDGKRTSP